MIYSYSWGTASAEFLVEVNLTCFWLCFERQSASSHYLRSKTAGTLGLVISIQWPEETCTDLTKKNSGISSGFSQLNCHWTKWFSLETKSARENSNILAVSHNVCLRHSLNTVAVEQQLCVPVRSPAPACSWEQDLSRIVESPGLVQNSPIEISLWVPPTPSFKTNIATVTTEQPLWSMSTSLKLSYKSFLHQEWYSNRLRDPWGHSKPQRFLLGLIKPKRSAIC